MQPPFLIIFIKARLRVITLITNRDIYTNTLTFMIINKQKHTAGESHRLALVTNRNFR